jgi:hypothetical protein
MKTRSADRGNIRGNAVSSQKPSSQARSTMEIAGRTEACNDHINFQGIR